MNDYGNSTPLFPCILKTWNDLFPAIGEAQNTRPFHHDLLNREADEFATFSPLECTGERLQVNNRNGVENTSTFCISESVDMSSKEVSPLLPIPRCLSCKKDISNQNTNSIFCSEKIYGRKAKKCRNRNSNERRNKKRIIKKATLTNKYLSISYQDPTGPIFSYLLHPTELILTKDLLDKIQNILIMVD